MGLSGPKMQLKERDVHPSKLSTFPSKSLEHMLKKKQAHAALFPTGVCSHNGELLQVPPTEAGIHCWQQKTLNNPKLGNAVKSQQRIIPSKPRSAVMYQSGR